MIHLVAQFHSIENMYATLLIMGYTMLILFVGIMVYTRYKDKITLWFLLSIVVICWVFGVYLIQIWCIDIGWITSSGDMMNMSRV